jgi:hypothetical protein
MAVGLSNASEICGKIWKMKCLSASFCTLLARRIHTVFSLAKSPTFSKSGERVWSIFRVRGNKTCSSPQTSYPDGMASIRRGLAALVRGVCSVAGSSVEWELQLTRSSSICVLVDCHKWSILLVKGGFKDFAMLAVFPQHSAPNRSLSSRLPSPLVIHLQQEQVS